MANRKSRAKPPATHKLHARKRAQATFRGRFVRSYRYSPMRYVAASTVHANGCITPPPPHVLTKKEDGRLVKEYVLDGTIRNGIWYVPKPDKTNRATRAINLIYAHIFPNKAFDYLYRTCKTKGCLNAGHYSPEEHYMHIDQTTLLRLCKAAEQSIAIRTIYHVPFDSAKEARSCYNGILGAMRTLKLHNPPKHAEITTTLLIKLSKGANEITFDSKINSIAASKVFDRLNLPPLDEEVQMPAINPFGFSDNLDDMTDMPEPPSIAEQLYGKKFTPDGK